MVFNSEMLGTTIGQLTRLWMMNYTLNDAMDLIVQFHTDGFQSALVVVT
jgi:hypothetical protein